MFFSNNLLAALLCVISLDALWANPVHSKFTKGLKYTNECIQEYVEVYLECMESATNFSVVPESLISLSMVANDENLV
jgi:hypothetical protein